MKKTLIILTILFCSYNFTAFSQATVEFETITEALNYDGDRDAVKKLIITGTISGDDYSPTSEWSKFRTLDETFPNIEEVEILTSQDIPDVREEEQIGFFVYFDDNIDRPIVSDWLKIFSAPNIKNIGMGAFIFCYKLSAVDFPLATAIGDYAFASCISLTSIDFPLVTTIEDNAFYNCVSLLSIDFPLATTIGNHAFEDCTSLTSINFPLVTTIGESAFSRCDLLEAVTLGTGFEIETEIKFDEYVFSCYKNLAPNIDLILGEYVFPKPDLAARIWQSTNAYTPSAPTCGGSYIWKSINVYLGIEDEEINNKFISYLGNNVYRLENIKEAKLYDIMGRQIMNLGNEKTIDLNNLPTGIYFLQYFDGKKIKTEKIIKH